MSDAIQKAEFWKSHVEKQLSSGLSRAAYCRLHGLKVHQLNYFAGKFGRTCDTDEPGSSAFAQVQVKSEANHSPTPPSGLRLLVGRDLCLAFDGPVGSAWMASLLRDLR